MLKIEALEPRTSKKQDLDAWCAIFTEGQAELSGDVTDSDALAERIRLEPENRTQRWLARQAGTPCGVAELQAQQHDPATGYLRLFVTPPARRRGVGTRLLAQVAADADVERIQATVLSGPPGEPFVGRWRVVLRLELHEQRLEQNTLRRCHELATAAHPDHRLVTWQGPAPEESAASFGRVMGHVLDAPGAELQMATRPWDTTAVRAWEAEMGGRHLLVTAAVHSPSGDIVGATVTTVGCGETTVAEQHDTAVLPGQRRGGLARWMKARQTLRLHELFPRVESVRVTVNQQNAPMLAVNRAVGYHLLRQRLLVEAPTHQLRA
ncbi:acetyltransferase (GNAT) family protein [Actinomadura pelletieri DSM 43383]|uniref:Acetyltransferase (GNAT) family protein n=1 Tax=Actinomadura pelletieri DSM 43383 TaxID=1120940 RepID=A0A495QLS3_9ACTN|nr:acetyltransferase (GNAT) family protein [Actinomadura pelletieri DSM 43383]